MSAALGLAARLPTALLLLATLLFSLSAEATVRFALVAGNNLGGEERAALRWAEADARRVHQLFVELGGVDSRRALLLLGGDARALELELANLRGQLEEAKRRGERTEVFVYYSGHGDREALHLGDSRVALATLEKWLGELPADALLTVIDACRTGAVRSGAARGVRPAPAFDVRVARQAGPEGRILIQSAGADEVAQESDDLQGGFFTHQLVTGLRGAADADRDKRVTVAEAYRYAYDRTLSLSFGAAAAVQHPSMDVQLEGEGELAVTQLSRAAATLLLEPGLRGEVLVIDDATSRVVAELRLRGDAPLELALPAGQYRLLQREGGRIFAGPLVLHASSVRRVAPGSLTEQPRIAALRRGAGWDPTPWRLSLSGVVSAAPALDGGHALGAQLGLERRAAAPWFWTARLAGTHAQGQGELWSVRHRQLTLGGGAGAAASFGPFRAQVALTLEGVGVWSRARRADAARLQALGLDTWRGGWSLGPGLGGEAVLAYLLPGRWELRAGAGGALQWLKVDGELQDGLSPRAQLGLGRAF